METKKPAIRKPRGRKIKPRERVKPKPTQPLRKPKKIGYMRVSTDKQEMALQIEAMFEAGIEWDDIYADTISGSKVNRKWRDACLKYLIPGDKLYVWKLDRFSRSLKDLLIKLDELKEKGVGFRSITQDIDTTTPAGRMMMQMVGSFAEFETEMIRERVTAGIQAKISEGNVRWGRQPAVDYDEEEIKKMLRQKIPHRTIAAAIGISKGTVGNVSKKMKGKKK